MENNRMHKYIANSPVDKLNDSTSSEFVESEEKSVSDKIKERKHFVDMHLKNIKLNTARESIDSSTNINLSTNIHISRIGIIVLI